MATKGASFQFNYNAWAVPGAGGLQLLPSFYAVSGWRMYLSTVAYDTLLGSHKMDNPPNRENYAEASASGLFDGFYPQGGVLLTTLLKTAADAAADGICEIALDPATHAGNVIEIDSHPDNPVDTRSAIFIDSASIGPLCIVAVELTNDNDGPVDMVTDILRVTPDAAGEAGRIYYSDTT